jgi:hypothetical protein
MTPLVEELVPAPRSCALLRALRRTALSTAPRQRVAGRATRAALVSLRGIQRWSFAARGPARNESTATARGTPCTAMRLSAVATSSRHISPDR